MVAVVLTVAMVAAVNHTIGGGGSGSGAGVRFG